MLSPARVVFDGNRLLQVEAKGDKIHAEAVICAVPWFALADLFGGGAPPSLKPLVQAAEKTAPSPIASVNIWLDRRVLGSPFLGLPGRSLQWVFDKGQMFDEASSHLTMVASSAEQLMTLSNDALAAVALQELRDALPEVRAAKVLRTSVVRERRASFSLAPGQPARPGCRTPVDHLVLAGDWIDTGLPATIESAAVSGRRAAEAIS